MNYQPEKLRNNILKDPQIVFLPDQWVFQKLLEQDLRKNTKKALESDFKHFVRWYVETNKEKFRFDRLTERDIADYKHSCKEGGHAVNTINRRLIHLRLLCSAALEENRLKENVAKKVKLLQLQRLAPKSLESHELRRLLKEVEIRGRLRDRLFIEMLAGAGFRMSELANLNVEDIFLSDRKGHVVVRNGKGGKTREVPLNKKIRELLQEYLAKQQPSASGRLFLGQRGPLTTNSFNRILDFYAEKAGIKCHPHLLRHTFSYHYLTQTQNDIVGLAQILGHSSLNTTAIYTQNRLEDLQAKVEGMGY